MRVISEQDREAVENRFWAKVDKRGPDECWVWSAALFPHSRYGAFRINEKVRYAHRIAFELVVGPIPAGLCIDHLCRVRHCVNPAHMEPVTAAENTRRGVSANAAKTHCPQGHPYAGDNLYLAPVGVNRRCRTCMRGRRASAEACR